MEQCPQHIEMAVAIGKVDTRLDGMEKTLARIEVKLDRGEIRFAKIEERQTIAETRSGINIDTETDTAEFSIKKGKVTADITKIDWPKVGRWVTMAGTFLLAAIAYIKGGR